MKLNTRHDIIDQTLCVSKKVPSVFTVKVRMYYAAVEASVMMTSVAIKLFFDSLVGCTGRKSKNIIRIMFVRQISRMQEPRIS